MVLSPTLKVALVLGILLLIWLDNRFFGGFILGMLFRGILSKGRGGKGGRGGGFGGGFGGGSSGGGGRSGGGGASGRF